MVGLYNLFPLHNCVGEKCFNEHWRINSIFLGKYSPLSSTSIAKVDHPAFPDTNQSNQCTDYCPEPSEQMHSMLSMPIEPTTIAPPSTSIANVDQSKVFQCKVFQGNMPRCQMVLRGLTNGTKTITGSKCFQVELIKAETNTYHQEHIATLFVAKRAIEDINHVNNLIIQALIGRNAGSP